MGRRRIMVVEDKLRSITFGVANAHKHRSGIYQLKSEYNGKFYIGSAVSFYNRLHTHSHHLREETHFNDHLIAHKNKYGIEDLVMEVLEFVDDPDKNLIRREQWWLDNTDCLNREVGFNKCPTAQSQLNREMSDVHREKVGKRSIGNKYRKGFKVTDKTKFNIAKAQGARRIAQFTMTGKLVQVFQTIGETENFGYTKTNVLRVTQGKVKAYRGFFWRYLEENENENELSVEDIFQVSFKRFVKKIHLLDDNGESVKTWTSVREASKELGLPMKRCLDCCKGKVKKVGGVILKYETEYV